MLKSVFGRPNLFAVILALSVAFASSNAFAQHGHAGSGHAGGGHAGGGHAGGGQVGHMGGGSVHHGGSHHGGYGGGYGGGIGIGIGSYGLGGLGYSGFGGYGGLGYSSLSLGYGNYGGYSPYSSYGSSYSGYGSYAPQFYSARPAASIYIAPAYSYAQPQTYRVQGYSTQMPAQVQPSAAGSDLRPGMVLPDGAIVTSVGPIR